VRRVRSDKSVRTSSCRFIMVTGYRRVSRVREARDAGVNERHHQAADTSVLFDRIQSCVEDTRNFIRTDSFFGPDRRRGKRPALSGGRAAALTLQSQLSAGPYEQRGAWHGHPADLASPRQVDTKGGVDPTVAVNRAKVIIQEFAGDFAQESNTVSASSKRR